MKATPLLLALGVAGIGCAKSAPPPAQTPRDNKYFAQQTARPARASTSST